MPSNSEITDAEKAVNDELGKGTYDANYQFWRYLMRMRVTEAPAGRRSSGPERYMKKSIMHGVAGILLKAGLSILLVFLR